MINYTELKKAIIKVCKQDGRGALNFSINGMKLNDAVKDEFGLIFLQNVFKSTQVDSTNIPLLGEYYKKEKLAWFNRSRQFMTVSFVVKEKLDERGRELVELLYDQNRSKDPSFDRADIVAELIAYYPCYSATIVSYKSEDPDRIGKISYNIVIRANVNAILMEEGEYYNPDNENNG
jgi:hypothetical protein